MVPIIMDITKAQSHSARKSLTWLRIERANNSPTALIICECGRETTLDNHLIYPDGIVTPSVDCPNNNCDFHEYVRLENWEPT